MLKVFLQNSKVTALSGLAFCLFASVSFAQDDSVFAINAKLGFFNQDSVVNMDRPLEYSKQEEIQMGPTKGFDLSRDFKVDNVKLNQDPKQNTKAEEKIPEGVDPQEYTLKKEFGDPSVPVPVKGTDNAPAPYKAMLKAFDMGRDDLALQYAEQWMGYMRSLERVTQKASAMSQIVGLRPDQVENQLSPETLAQIDSAGLQKYLEAKQNHLADNSQGGNLALENSTLEKINALFGENESQYNLSALNKDPINQMMDRSKNPEERKRLIRQHLSSKLPRDPSGKIKILFFMKPSDPISTMVGKELARAIGSETNTFPVAVVPLSVDPIGQDTTSNFVASTGLPAVVRDGSVLYSSLKIAKAPAVVFLTSASDKSFVQTGPVDSVFVQEVINIIGGR